jgi:hypothetical protein
VDRPGLVRRRAGTHRQLRAVALDRTPHSMRLGASFMPASTADARPFSAPNESRPCHSAV